MTLLLRSQLILNRIPALKIHVKILIKTLKDCRVLDKRNKIIQNFKGEKRWFLTKAYKGIKLLANIKDRPQDHSLMINLNLLIIVTS